ncbi:MAG: hypothetical protein JW795_20915 [Chitinivibrionales bacterium]|nr:hypothetical protein [Chitinivibrionales bacterium]
MIRRVLICCTAAFLIATIGCNSDKSFSPAGSDRASVLPPGAPTVKLLLAFNSPYGVKALDESSAILTTVNSSFYATNISGRTENYSVNPPVISPYFAIKNGLVYRNGAAVNNGGRTFIDLDVSQTTCWAITKKGTTCIYNASTNSMVKVDSMPQLIGTPVYLKIDAASNLCAWILAKNSTVYPNTYNFIKLTVGVPNYVRIVKITTTDQINDIACLNADDGFISMGNPGVLNRYHDTQIGSITPVRADIVECNDAIPYYIVKADPSNGSKPTLYFNNGASSLTLPAIPRDIGMMASY